MKRAGTVASTSRESNGRHIRAYLASMRIDPGSRPIDRALQEAFERGRSEIEKMAIALDASKDLFWDADQCADVLTWMDFVRPVKPATWWTKGDRISHVRGYYDVLDTLASSLRPRPVGWPKPAAALAEAKRLAATLAHQSEVQS